ncbi:transcriptional regulator [Enterovibrio norvegicus FF-162]|uniref:bifunctional transcriptional activator/DNA repair enzyme AdaA n=1 Tax=Enterovibrio norvegicus TaxID=188144 RepID=UPI0002D77444|nr:AlkA N-terminal domain-containing protein [Enterovibrio norvegicus]OEE77300.1 transcriptional regulator [Enterovibrio norvegicus FF-162]
MNTNITHFQQARLSRDARFDGLFYTAVLTTGIYCRSICPAPPPKEENVRYFSTAHEAASQGFRPCLRCRPDSAPGSPAWLGKETTLKRALGLIQDGFLQENSIPDLAERLGVTDRYVRKLFSESLGCSPKQYALYQQILFAKKLLHETTLPIADIAFAAGFNSVRRFNDCFHLQLALSPTQVRGKKTSPSESLSVTLSYRPPYDWKQFHSFVAARLIPNVEWLSESGYGRTFINGNQRGQFTATWEPDKNRFRVALQLSEPKHLYSVLNRIRKLLDLDANPDAIAQTMADATNQSASNGTRIPGTWDTFEAGVRAMFGESVLGAAAHISSIEHVLIHDANTHVAYFPSANTWLSHVELLPLPDANKQPLSAWAAFCLSQQTAHTSVDTDTDGRNVRDIRTHPLSTMQYNYACLRGAGLPDIADLLDDANNIPSSSNHAAPWRSYLSLSQIHEQQSTALNQPQGAIGKNKDIS